MKPQHTIIKLIAIPVILIVFLNSALVLPSVSAQDEFSSTSTPTLTFVQEPTEEPIYEFPPTSTPTPAEDATEEPVDEFTPTPTLTQTSTEESTEEPVTDEPFEPTRQPSDNPPSEDPSIQSFSASAPDTPSQPDSDCSDGRCVFWVKASTDDAGVGIFPGSCTYAMARNEIYMGECSGQPITSGFRFPNVTIPPGTIIQDAHIEFTVDGPYSDDLNVVFLGENVANSFPFSFISRPTNRPLTAESVPWHIQSSDPWTLGQIKDSPPLTTIVQAIINRPDWVSGNAIAIIQKNVGPSSGSYKLRRVIGYDRPVWYPGAQNAARLVVNLKYDCSEYESALSPIEQAVLSSLDEPQNFCLNKFEELIDIPQPALPSNNNPTGKIAFDKLADLIEEANYEVDFTTMIWEDSTAGRIILKGVQELYHKVTGDTTGKYAKGVTIRILLGLEHYESQPDQRENVLKELDKLDVPDETPDHKWKVEVASYRESDTDPSYPYAGIHSHAKILVVDGHELIVSGYNVQDSYLAENDPTTDMGIQVSGPIAQNALNVFDKLWAESRLCSNLCNDTDTAPSRDEISHLPEVTTISPSGSVNVFSLYRDDSEKFADDAIEAALSAATQNVFLLENRYFEDSPQWHVEDPLTHLPISITLPPSPETNSTMGYTEGILTALENGADITFILSGTGGDKIYSATSIINLMRNIDSAGISLQPGQTLCAKMVPTMLHAKSMSLDGEFLIIGSQNLDFSAFGEFGNYYIGLDLAEYNLGTNDNDAVSTFNTRFDTELDRSEDIDFVSPPNTIDTWENIINCSESQNVQASITQTSPATIQSTIDRAEPGSYIALTPGIYTESVEINKPLTLFSFEPGLTIMKPPFSEPAFQITSSNVSIERLTVRGSGSYGIEVENATSSDFENIYLGNIVFENNTAGGILLSGESNGIQFILENNTFIGGESGITMDVAGNPPSSSLIRNNLLIGQTLAPVRIISPNDGGIEYRYNLFSLCPSFSGCELAWYSGTLHPDSNVHDNLFDLDPRFMDIGLGDYSLSSNSPVLEAGDNSAVDILHADGEYTLSFTSIGAFETVSVSTRPSPPPDDAPDLSGLITQDTAANINSRYLINPSNDEDWFRFYLNNAGNPQIHLTSLPANYDLYVYSSAGLLIGSSTKDKKSAEMVKLVNALPGYYYIRVLGVDGNWNATNPYQLRINTP